MPPQSPDSPCTPPSLQGQAASARHGFTLIELLVVISLILIVVTLSFATFSHVRDAGLAAKCLGNLRQIYQGTLAYTYDYDGLLFPQLGPMTEVDSRYTYNNYWWQQSYLAPYVIGPLGRLKDSRGKLSQSEATVFNCPARLKDGSDSAYAHPTNGNPGVSYVMTRLSPKRSAYLLRNMESPSSKIFLADGRYNTVVASTFQTGAIGSLNSAQRLRRFHGPGLNLLFFDGHTELYTGSDEALQNMLP